MKTNEFLLAAGIVLITGFVFYSCQKEQNTQPVKEQGTMTLKSGNCSDHCIDLTTADLYADTHTQVVSWGGPNNDRFTKTGTLRIWNTLTQIVYEFKSTVAIADLVVNGVSSGLSAAANTPLLYYIALPSGWKACDVITNTFALAGSGPQIQFNSVGYSLIGICTTTTIDVEPEGTICVGVTEVTVTGTVSSVGNFTGGTISIYEGTTSLATAAVSSVTNVYSVTFSYTPTAAGTRTFVAKYDGTGSNGYNPSESGSINVVAEDCGCDESFSYIADPNIANTWLFTYTPSEILTNVEVVFTFAQSDIPNVTGDVSVAAGWTNEGQTFHKVMNFAKCVPVTWRVTLFPKCQGGAGMNNLWTDFKIGDVSKKPDGMPNITVPCP